MCGGVASGKSRVARRLAGEGFVHVSNDLQGRSRAGRLYAEALARGDRVVVDNTHPLAADRAALARQALAAGRDYAVAVIHLTAPKELCFHLNAARCQLDPSGATPEVPAIALHSYWKKLQTPEVEEVRGYGARAGVLIRLPFVLEPDAPPEVAAFRYC
jgi:predicted kinase